MSVSPSVRDFDVESPAYDAYVTTCVRIGHVRQNGALVCANCGTSVLVAGDIIGHDFDEGGSHFRLVRAVDALGVEWQSLAQAVSGYDAPCDLQADGWTFRPVDAETLAQAYYVTTRVYVFVAAREA